MTSVSSEIEQLIARLAPETRRRRQSALMRPLNTSLIIITLIGLVFVFAGRWELTSALILSISLFLNLLVAFLDSRGLTHIAAHLFSIGVNVGIILLSALNLALVNSTALGTMFACQLALSVILAGLLLGVAYAFLFAAVNVVAVIWLFYYYTATTGAAAGEGPWSGVISFGVPVSAFLVIMAVVTWLYQRALSKAELLNEAARKRIIEGELIRRDLAIARELQLRLYPQPPSTTAALQIASRTVPARETSGDFYDFIELGEGQLGIVVADVTGKSVAAALMMALARVTIRSEARRHTAPGEVLRNANETICRDHTARQMITAFYGLLDTSTMTLRFANAGHPYPILRRGNELIEVEIGGMPLGGRSDMRYAEHSLQIEPGDQIFLLSDGLIEERNSHRELFGYDRLGAAILSTDHVDPDAAIEGLWDTVASFRGGAEQSDDITLVVIQALPAVAVVGKPKPPPASGFAAS